MIWLTVFIIFLAYCYGKLTFSYWTKRGVKQASFISFLRTVKRLCLKQVSAAEAYEEFYKNYPEERFVGSYFGAVPLLIIRDLELIKRLLVTDFDHFYSRSLHPLDKVPEPLLNNLFSCEGDLWKLLRQSLTPAFSSGKIKAMFPLVLSRAEKLKRIAAEDAIDEIDVKDLMSRYATDITGACGFGINTDTLNDDHKAFLKLGRRIFTKTARDIAVYILKFTMPALFSFLHLSAPFLEETTNALVGTIMQQRNYKPSERRDFIDLLLELKERGTIVGNSLRIKNPDGSPCKVELEFSDALLVAQVFTFFAAGAETTATATSYLLHELAHHPEYQQKCQEEIDEVLARHENQLTFEAVKEMKYLDICLRESMRVFAPIGYLIRKCMKRYTIPDTSITLDAGVFVVIPVKALHLDSRYFADPGRFCPDRFHPDNVSAFNKNAYLPFGAGPRACIGERLGHMQSLAALAALLRCASVTPGVRTRRSPPLDPSATMVQKVLGPLSLKITRR